MAYIIVKSEKDARKFQKDLDKLMEWEKDLNDGTSPREVLNMYHQKTATRLISFLIPCVVTY